MNSDKLTTEFYTRKDVVLIARELLGKVLYAFIDNHLTSGIIIETEAYAGINDKASHAYNCRRTNRTEVMYREGGCAYVYLCYGIHSLFNIVTSVQDDPHAVLIRGIIPLQGIDTMKDRLKKETVLPRNFVGPGNVARVMGINVSHTGVNLCPEKDEKQIIWINDESNIVPEEEIFASPRIGIDYAGEDARLLYRFQWIKK